MNKKKLVEFLPLKPFRTSGAVVGHDKKLPTGRRSEICLPFFIHEP